jgi:peptide deformylase
LSILPIFLDGTEPLRKKAKPVKEVNDGIIKFVMDMFETMHIADGVGLAANQVGVLQRIIVVDISYIEEYKEIKPIALINPEIIYKEGKCTMEEGCLSVPEIRAEVERPKTIKVKYRDLNFQEIEIEATGMLARVILHELDHLNGVLFIDYIPKSKKKVYKEQLIKIQNGEIETKYPIISAPNVRL